MSTKESDIQRAVKEYLRYRGWFVVKIHQSLGSYRGIADLYCLRQGRSLWVEVKTKTGKQSDYQEKFQTDLEAVGGEYILCRGIDDLIERGI